MATGLLVDGFIEQAGLGQVKLLAASAELAKSFNTVISCVSWFILAWRYLISRSLLAVVSFCLIIFPSRSNTVFVRVHELPPSSPRFCPHPQAPDFD